MDFLEQLRAWAPLAISAVALGISIRADRRAAAGQARDAVRWEATSMELVGDEVRVNVRNLGHEDAHDVEVDPTSLGMAAARGLRPQWRVEPSEAMSVRLSGPEEVLRLFDTLRISWWTSGSTNLRRRQRRASVDLTPARDKFLQELRASAEAATRQAKPDPSP